MSFVYIAQLLCPERHCVIALAGLATSLAEAEADLKLKLLEGFGAACAAGLFNRECGICQSRDLHVEVGQTKFRTIKDAQGPLEENARQQAATAAFLKGGRN